MKEKEDLAEILKEKALTLKKAKQKSLSETLLRGKICREIREKLNCYKEFKLWSSETGYSIATLNRDINRYELYELMKEEAYVYCDDKYLIWEEPAGNYKVEVFALDNGGNGSARLTNYFEYRPFNGF